MLSWWTGGFCTIGPSLKYNGHDAKIFAGRKISQICKENDQSLGFMRHLCTSLLIPALVVVHACTCDQNLLMAFVCKLYICILHAAQ